MLMRMTTLETREALYELRQTEVPVAVHLGGIIASTDVSAGWVSDVALHSAGVVFNVSVVGERGTRVRTDHLLGGSDPIDMIGWQEQDPTDVHVYVAVDGTVIPTVPMERYLPDSAALALFAVGGSSSGRRASASWWLPAIPKESLTVGLESHTMNLNGSLSLEATGWVSRLPEVLTL